MINQWYSSSLWFALLVTTGGAGSATTAFTSAPVPTPSDYPPTTVGKSSWDLSSCFSALAFLAWDRCISLGHGAQGVKAFPTIDTLVFVNWHKLFLKLTFLVLLREISSAQNFLTAFFFSNSIQAITVCWNYLIDFNGNSSAGQCSFAGYSGQIYRISAFIFDFIPRPFYSGHG